MLTKQFKPWTESKWEFRYKKYFLYIFCVIRTIDNSRVGVSFARRRTIGGRRGGFSNGGDRYSRGSRDSPRYRRRYSPRHSDDGRDRYDLS